MPQNVCIGFATSQNLHHQCRWFPHVPTTSRFHGRKTGFLDSLGSLNQSAIVDDWYLYLFSTVSLFVLTHSKLTRKSSVNQLMVFTCFYCKLWIVFFWYLVLVPSCVASFHVQWVFYNIGLVALPNIQSKKETQYKPSSKNRWFPAENSMKNKSCFPIGTGCQWWLSPRETTYRTPIFVARFPNITSEKTFMFPMVVWTPQ